MEYLAQGLLFIIAFGSIIFLAYITTRFIAGKSQQTMKGRHIRVLETVSLGMDKRLHLVKAGGQFILVASSGKRIEFLTEVKLDDYQDEEETGRSGSFDFKSIFEKYTQIYKDKKGAGTGRTNPGTLEKEGRPERIRSNLSRLKDINRRAAAAAMSNEDADTNEKADANEK